MIRFSKFIWLYFLLSVLILAPGISSLVRWGLRPSIDFTGGALVEVRLTGGVILESVEKASNQAGLSAATIQKTDQSLIFRMKNEESERIASFTALLASASPSATIVRNETVGPILGAELLKKALAASALAVVAILLYVAYAFKNLKFGVSAILALFHDLLVVVGLFSLFGHFLNVEVDTLFVTAVLTTMSFSVHDTIVVFDRIREYSKKGIKGTFEELCDQALTETMGRSLTNSFTIVFMLVALVLMGGETIRWFVVALLIGTISGTYSSPFIATPILILWNKFEKNKNKVL